METIRLGFIGSRFAAELHAHSLSRIRGSKCDIVAVCSKTRARAEAFARAWGSQFVVAGALGHINSASGLGARASGRAVLEELLTAEEAG